MDDSFFKYLEQLETMLFFSGYPLIYLLIRTIAGKEQVIKMFNKNISLILPYAYACAGVLFLALQAKNLYPDYSLTHIKTAIELPALKIWGLLSIFFFIPALSRKPLYSLLHSLIFFGFLIRDIWLNISDQSDPSLLKNDMSIYSYSLLLQLTLFVMILIFVFIVNKFRNSVRGK